MTWTLDLREQLRNSQAELVLAAGPERRRTIVVLSGFCILAGAMTFSVSVHICAYVAVVASLVFPPKWWMWSVLSLAGPTALTIIDGGGILPFLILVLMFGLMSWSFAAVGAGVRSARWTERAKWSVAALGFCAFFFIFPGIVLKVSWAFVQTSRACSIAASTPPKVAEKRARSLGLQARLSRPIAAAEDPRVVEELWAQEGFIFSRRICTASYDANGRVVTTKLWGVD